MSSDAGFYVNRKQAYDGFIKPTWTVSMQTFYTHVEKGYVPQSDKGFSREALRHYAHARSLPRRDGGNGLGSDSIALDEMEVARINKEKDAAREKKAAADIKELERDRLYNRCIDIDEHNEQFARAARILKEGGYRFFNEKAPELVHLAAGDPGKVEDVKRFMLREFEDWLHGFSVKKPHEVPEDDSLTAA